MKTNRGISIGGAIVMVAMMAGIVWGVKYIATSDTSTLTAKTAVKGQSASPVAAVKFSTSTTATTTKTITASSTVKIASTTATTTKASTTTKPR